MSNPSLEQLAHESQNSADATAIILGGIIPASFHHGAVSAWVHAYDPADKSKYALFRVEGVFERTSQGCIVHGSEVFNFQSSPGFANVSGEISTASVGGELHVVVLGAGINAQDIEWHMSSFTMWEPS